MFSRFGKILALTMTLSLVYTLFMAGSLLAVFAPTKFSGECNSVAWQLLLGNCCLVTVARLVTYLVT